MRAPCLRWPQGAQARQRPLARRVLRCSQQSLSAFQPVRRGKPGRRRARPQHSRGPGRGAAGNHRGGEVLPWHRLRPADAQPGRPRRRHRRPNPLAKACQPPTTRGTTKRPGLKPDLMTRARLGWPSVNRLQLRNGIPPPVGFAPPGTGRCGCSWSTTPWPRPPVACRGSLPSSACRRPTCAIISQDWLTQVEVVKLSDALRQADPRAVQIREWDRADFPAAALAALLSPCLLLTHNRPDRRGTRPNRTRPVTS